MKNLIKKGIKLTLFIILIGSLLLSGCGAARNSETAPSQSESKAEYGGSPTQDQAEEAKTDSGFTPEMNVSSDKMMIYTGDLRLEVENMEEATDVISSLITNNGGYLVNSNYQENGNSFYANVEYRVPVQGFKSVIDQIGALEEVSLKNQNVNGNDVTEQYYDLESRLKAKRVYEQRLLAFLEKAEKTEDLLKISNDLNRVQEEIEQMEGRARYLKNHASFSTLRISMEQRKDKVASTASVWEKAQGGFKNSIESIIEMAKGIFIWTISTLPILVLLGIVGFGLWRARKTLRSRIKRSTLPNDNDDEKK